VDLPEDSPPPYGTIVFDCDSTLSFIEGIEALAGERRARIEALTRQAMEGAVPLEKVFGLRLEEIRPSRAAVGEVARAYADEALPGAALLVAALRSLEKRVVVVSGGLMPAVRPFAESLGFDGERDVYAVAISFDGDGEYADFDRSSPLTRSGGKIPILAEIAAAPGAGPVAMIGDGITDLETASEVSRFIAFGGVVRRKSVFDRSRITCEVANFAALLPLLCSTDEIATLTGRPECAPLLEAAAPFF
jgi:phosphoserine phosphatase